MRWNILIPVIIVAVASTAVGVLAVPSDGPANPPTVADQAIDHADDHAGPALTDGVDPQGVPDVTLSAGQPDVLGILEENTHPCDNVTDTDGDGTGCRQVENAGGNILNLPDPAADGIEAAIEHQNEAQPNAEDAASNGVGNGPPAEVSQGPADAPHGPPDDVPRGGPNAAGSD